MINLAFSNETFLFFGNEYEEDTTNLQYLR